MAKLYVGFDPGGQDAFGWSICAGEGKRLSLKKWGSVNNCFEAFESVAHECKKQTPDAIGIDAPLFWNYSGDRNADLAVRKLVKVHGGRPATVNHVNSMRGACLVQGVLVARLARNRWPNVLITEAHPKALKQVLQEARAFRKTLPKEGEDGDHKHDAALAAYSAWIAHAQTRAQTKDWQNLAPTRNSDEVYVPVGQVCYWFPK